LTEVPLVPLTIEGSCVLHQMFRFNWAGWRRLPAAERAGIAQSAAEVLRGMEHSPAPDDACRTAIYSQLGHKGDLVLIHLRPSVEALNRVELELSRTPLYDFLEITSSYLSVVELGLYESSAKTYAALAERGLQPHSAEWNQAIEEVLQRQTEAMAPRLFPSVPEAKYLCFYPMDRRRGEEVNWYTVSMDERQQMMHEHGLIGRRYAGQVRQIITGSIGWDDWEWGVDLFAEDPLIFKKLIYEMRFDKVSALYALFGPFYIGLRLPVEQLGSWLSGESVRDNA
jgi:peroxiredoxin